MKIWDYTRNASNLTCRSWKSLPACGLASNKECRYKCKKYLESNLSLALWSCVTTSEGIIISLYWMNKETARLQSSIINWTSCIQNIQDRIDYHHKDLPVATITRLQNISKTKNNQGQCIHHGNSPQRAITWIKRLRKLKKSSFDDSDMNNTKLRKHGEYVDTNKFHRFPF